MILYLNITKAFHPINRKNLLGEFWHNCNWFLKNAAINLVKNVPQDFLKTL